MATNDERPFEDLLGDKTGLLWWINRNLFHPRGFALALVSGSANGEINKWQLLGDGIDPWTFESEGEIELLAKINVLLAPQSNREAMEVIK